jgi:hypothetical protein
VSENRELNRTVGMVLVIAADPNIEVLVGELVAFAGHRPVYDPTLGAAGESVRRVRPDVLALDTSLPPAVVSACLTAADEVAARPVLMSSTASASELAAIASARGCLYFVLPGGPKPLRKILERALAEKPSRRFVVIPETRSTGLGLGSASVQPAMCAALASFARAHAGVESDRGRAALRAAVTDYAVQLKASALPADRVVAMVQDAVCDSARVVGAESTATTLLRESEDWALQAYTAA